MERGKSWRHEGGGFRKSLKRGRSNGLDGVREPLVDGRLPDVEKQGQGERPLSTSGWGGEYVKSIVYGGLDAIVTSFALVASVSGGDLPAGAVLVLGFANLIADGISMGFGDYLSSTAERDFVSNQQEVAAWEVQNDIHAEMLGMVSAYAEQGMEKHDADQLVDILSKYKDIMRDHVLTVRQGLIPPDQEDSPLKNGLITFTSFLLFGCTPLLSYLVLNPFTNNKHYKFIGACVVTALALILLGLAKARVSGQKYLGSVLVVLCNGGIAAAAAYLISYVLNNVFGISE